MENLTFRQKGILIFTALLIAGCIAVPPWGRMQTYGKVLFEGYAPIWAKSGVMDSSRLMLQCVGICAMGFVLFIIAGGDRNDTPSMLWKRIRWPIVIGLAALGIGIGLAFYSVAENWNNAYVVYSKYEQRRKAFEARWDASVLDLQKTYDQRVEEVRGNPDSIKEAKSQNFSKWYWDRRKSIDKRAQSSDFVTRQAAESERYQLDLEWQKFQSTLSFETERAAEKAEKQLEADRVDALTKMLNRRATAKEKEFPGRAPLYPDLEVSDQVDAWSIGLSIAGGILILVIGTIFLWKPRIGPSADL